MSDMLMRLLWGVLASGCLAVLAWRLALVTGPGALTGFAVGSAVFLGTGPGGFACLAAFFVAGSVLTRVGYARKAARGIAEARGGARGAWEVLAKGGVSAALALGVLWGPGTVFFRIGFVGALAAALGDTASTEVGQLAPGGARSLVGWQRVRAGTPGAVSLLGLAAGATGSLAVAGLAWVLGLVSLGAGGAAAVGGLAGNLSESLFQDAAGRTLNHHVMNLVATADGALVAVALWSLFG